MAEVLLVLLLGAAIVGLIVASVLPVRGLSRRRSTIAAVTAAAAGLAAVVLYGFELLAYALNESGPEYYDWSTYVEYHELPGAVAIALLAVYALLPDEARGEDAALYSTGRPAERSGSDIRACLPYGFDGGPDAQTQEAVLCLYVADTPRGRRLLDPEAGGIETNRIADELNDAGVEPRDDVDELDALVVERAEWRG